MTFNRLSFFLIVLLSLLGVSNVQAMTHADHHHNHQTVQNDYVKASPFDRKAEGLAIHCILKKHDDKKFCPHSQKPLKSNREFSLYSNCGRHSHGSLPAKVFSHAKELIKSQFIFVNVSTSSRKVHPSPLTEYSNSPELLDPPPRFI